MNLERIVPSEIRQKKANIVCTRLYMESKRSELIEIESRIVIPRDWRVGKMRRGWLKKIQLKDD